MVVVADAAIDAGRRAGLWTVAGIGTANGTMAVAAAFGLSAAVAGAPVVLRVISVAGAAYLAWLGLRALVRAAGGEKNGLKTGGGHDEHPASTPAINRFGRGLLTNYANPSVVLFYAVVVPQFIAPHDAFLSRYLVLGGLHVAMSVVWQGFVAISVGTFAEHMTRPGVRRGIDLVMAVALLAFAVKLVAS